MPDLLNHLFQTLPKYTANIAKVTDIGNLFLCAISAKFTLIFYNTSKTK